MYPVDTVHDIPFLLQSSLGRIRKTGGQVDLWTILRDDRWVVVYTARFRILECRIYRKKRESVKLWNLKIQMKMKTRPSCSWYDRPVPFILVHFADVFMVHHVQGRKRKKLGDDQEHKNGVDAAEDQVRVGRNIFSKTW